MIYIASDHAGCDLKEKVVSDLIKSYACVDLGPFESSQSVDYPDYAHLLCEKIQEDPENRFGILICGSGIGMSMAANRHANIRAFVAFNDESIKLARQHNNANVLCLGARMFSKDEIFRWISIFLNQEFEAGRHTARVHKIELTLSNETLNEK